MTTITKVFLGLSLLGFVAGGAIDFSGAPLDPKWSAVMPLGAVFFGLFLIFLMLQKEMAAFDREEAAKMRQLEQPTSAPTPQPSSAGLAGGNRLKERVL